MKTIYKYELTVENIPVQMPKDSKIIKFAKINKQYFIWAIVETTNLKAEYYFEIFGTGWEIHYEYKRLKHIDSIFVDTFVWHLFQIIDDDL